MLGIVQYQQVYYGWHRRTLAQLQLYGTLVSLKRAGLLLVYILFDLWE